MHYSSSRFDRFRIVIDLMLLLNLLFRIEASWRHTRPETFSFEWPDLTEATTKHKNELNESIGPDAD